MIQIDMDKPSSCTECPMCSYEDDACLLMTSIYRTWSEQYSYCPIEEVENE